jgi:Apea-like HEPN
MTRIPDAEAIERITVAIGQPLLEFVLNTKVDAATSEGLSEAQIEALESMESALNPANTGYEPPQLQQVLRLGLTLPPGEDQPLANKMHVACGGRLPDLPDDDGSAEHIISILARDSYSAFLLPPDETLPAWMRRGTNIAVARGLLQHPQEKAFETAILNDPAFGRIFGDDQPHSGRSTIIYHSNFHAGGLQLMMLSHTILSSAWLQNPDRDRSLSMQDFCDSARSRLEFVRSALAGKPLTMRSRQAFTGVLLPPGTTWHAGKGVLVRETTPWDREFAPDSLKQQTSGTDAAGVTTVINHDGDVMVELDYPYKIMAFSEQPDDPGAIMDKLASPEVLERLTTRLRLSLMLAVQRPDHKVQIVPTWQFFDDPLESGFTMTWSDPAQAVGLMPTQLTPNDMRSWQEWYKLLGAPQADQIPVALSRIVKASAERRDPSDVLIDSVIAWENLFGSPRGEPTLRITASLALLLETEREARARLRNRLRDIYDLRSKVVHGSRALRNTEYSLCYEALDVAVRAVRTLLSERTDVLAKGSGDQRSLYLILGQ